MKPLGQSLFDLGTITFHRPLSFGKHFGDPSVTIGFDVTYLPWNLTFDLGTAVTQYLLEPHIHEGVDHDVVMTVRWDGWSNH